MGGSCSRREKKIPEKPNFDELDQCEICRRLLKCLETECGHCMCLNCSKNHCLSQTNWNLIGTIRCPGCERILSETFLRKVFNDKKIQKIRNKIDKPKKIPKFDCKICLCNYPVDQSITLTCDHRFCEACIKSYLQGQIMSSKVAESELICPIENCQQEVTPQEVQGNVEPQIYERFLEFRLRELPMKECPHCNFKFQVERNAQEINCLNCKKDFCPECNQSHKGMKCEEFKKEEELKDLNYSKCPSCQEAVVKESGCNFLRCPYPRCRTYFCLLCGDKLVRSDHYSHYKKTGPFGITCNTLDEAKYNN